MRFKSERESQKRYTHDQYLEHFFPSTLQPDLPETDNPYDLGVRLGKESMEKFTEGLKKSLGFWAVEPCPGSKHREESSRKLKS